MAWCRFAWFRSCILGTGGEEVFFSGQTQEESVPTEGHDLVPSFSRKPSCKTELGNHTVEKLHAARAHRTKNRPSYLGM